MTKESCSTGCQSSPTAPFVRTYFAPTQVQDACCVTSILLYRLGLENWRIQSDTVTRLRRKVLIFLMRLSLFFRGQDCPDSDNVIFPSRC